MTPQQQPKKQYAFPQDKVITGTGCVTSIDRTHLWYAKGGPRKSFERMDSEVVKMLQAGAK